MEIHRNRHYIYPDKDSLVAAFACEFCLFLEESPAEKKPVHVALSGGSTPLAIFRQLAETTTREHWSGVHLYWGDERCVSPESLESNYGNARKAMLLPLHIPGDHIHRIRGEEEPSAEADRYGAELREHVPVVNGWPVFDWIWLGIGEDGHTASIFPHQMELWKAETPCVVADHPLNSQKRISLTGGVINAAKRVSFIASGGDKSQVIQEVLMKEGNFMDYPAYYVNPDSGNLEWFLDKDATH